MINLLVKAEERGGSAHKHYWTEEERDIIRREYDGHNNTSDRIASKLGVTFYAVKGQAAKMGIMQDKSPDWSDKEVEILTEMITRYAPLKIARRLHRSVNSVVVKSKRLRLSRRVRDGWFTKKEVCEMLGVDHKKIQGYIDRGELKASWHNLTKPQKNGMAMWHIEVDDLKIFIKKNAGDFQGRNVDLLMIVWLLNSDI